MKIHRCDTCHTSVLSSGSKPALFAAESGAFAVESAAESTECEKLFRNKQLRVASMLRKCSISVASKIRRGGSEIRKIGKIAGRVAAARGFVLGPGSALRPRSCTVHRYGLTFVVGLGQVRQHGAAPGSPRLRSRRIDSFAMVKCSRLSLNCRWDSANCVGHLAGNRPCIFSQNLISAQA